MNEKKMKISNKIYIEMDDQTKKEIFAETHNNQGEKNKMPTKPEK